MASFFAGSRETTMSNRTEILHFRATPEEKAAIKANAGQAEVALSTWMRQRSLDREMQWGELRRRLDAAPTQSAVEEADLSTGSPALDRLLDQTEARLPKGGESYEQFMERRVGELLGDDASAEAQSQAQTTARAEWIASRPKEKKR